MGFDRDNRIPAYVLADSIIENSSIPVEFVFLHRQTLDKVFSRKRGEFESTEFSISRFLVPYLSDYKGWSLFIDNDMLVSGDVAELYELMNGDYTLRCVKHNQVVDSGVKFLGQKQASYNLKNWTSVILFNNERCSVLTPEFINNERGLNLHQLKWLPSLDEVGEIPFEWNYLCDTKSLGGQERVTKPKLVHYTLGGPFFEETIECEYYSEWIEIYERVNDFKCQR